MTTTGLGDEILWICPSLDDDGNGSAVAYDLAENGLNASLTFMDPATDWVADTDSGGVRAIDLDGVNDYLSIAHHSLINFERTNPFTLTGWIKASASGFYGVISKLDPASPYRGYEFALSSGDSQCSIYNSWPSNALQRNVLSSTYNPLGGVWRPFAMTYNGTSVAAALSIYWAGTLRTSSIIQNSLSATIQNTLPLIIGSRGGFFGNAPMRFDDFRIFGRVLTIPEITYLHSARAVLGQPPTGPTKAAIHYMRQTAGNL